MEWNWNKEMENIGEYLTPFFNGVSHNQNVTY